MAQRIPDEATIAADGSRIVVINTMPPRDPDEDDEDELEEELEEEEEDDDVEQPVVREPDEE